MSYYEDIPGEIMFAIVRALQAASEDALNDTCMVAAGERKSTVGDLDSARDPMFGYPGHELAQRDFYRAITAAYDAHLARLHEISTVLLHTLVLPKDEEQKNEKRHGEHARNWLQFTLADMAQALKEIRDTVVEKETAE